MKPTTLVFPIHENGQYILGLKRRGFGAHIYNGFGGKLEPGESFAQCAIRELQEESGLIAHESDLEPVGLLDFQFPYDNSLTHIGYVYLLRRFTGTPHTTDEMEVCAVEHMPYDNMWAGDRIWVERLLNGQLLLGRVVFGSDNRTVTHMELVPVDAVPTEQYALPDDFEQLVATHGTVYTEQELPS